MLKQAIRSYFSSLHPRNYKKFKRNGANFWLFYWALIYPVVMSATNPEAAKFMVFAMIKMIPFLIMGWSSLSSKFLMPKAMFLCPMKEEDRKTYINYVLAVKIGFPVLVGIVLELIWSIWGGFELMQILAIAFVNFSVGVATHICYEGKGSGDQRISHARTDKSGKTRWAWLNVVLMVWGLLLLAGFEAVDMTPGMGLTSAIIIGVSLVAFGIMDVYILTTQYRDTIRQAGNYELTFHVLSEVITNKK